MRFDDTGMRLLATCLAAALGLAGCGAAAEGEQSAATFSFHNEGWAAALAGETTELAAANETADVDGTADADAAAGEENDARGSADGGTANDGGDAADSTEDGADGAASEVDDAADDNELDADGAEGKADTDDADDAEDDADDAKATVNSDDADKSSGGAADKDGAGVDGTFAITLYANDGTDASDVVTADAEGGSITLPANEFSRKGYIFRGWSLKKSQAEPDYSDMDTVEDTSVTALYAMWEAQMYMIEFDGNTADYGETEGMYALYNANAFLSKNGFKKSGYTFSGWMDSAGNTYEDQERIKNLDTGDTNCTKVLTVDAGKPLDEDYTFRSTQGSCVYEEDGVTYLVTTASINDAAYNKGDLSHYETILNKYNLETGELVDSKRNLAFDHGNSICYNPDNRHLYIAEGGSRDEYPGGVMEVDEDLEEVAEYTFPLLDHIWAIAYDGEHFYILGKNEQSRNTLCTLNEEMKTLSYVELDDYYTQFSSQGIAADENYIYAVSAGFKTYEWKTKQRINVFTHEGRYIGVWTIDVQDEAEDITILDGYAYINTNEHAQSTIYRTQLPVVTLKAMWQKR